MAADGPDDRLREVTVASAEHGVLSGPGKTDEGAVDGNRLRRDVARGAVVDSGKRGQGRSADQDLRQTSAERRGEVRAVDRRALELERKGTARAVRVAERQRSAPGRAQDRVPRRDGV